MSPIQVAIVGNTGVGKSTLVNVLSGRLVADVDNNVRPCTTQTTSYDVVEGSSRYCIWDTRGLNEGSEKEPLLIRMMRLAGILPNAERELRRFLLRRNVDLVLLCIDAKKIRVKVHWKVYNRVYVDFCRRGVKVAVVVMQLSERDIVGSDWKRTCRVTAEETVSSEDFPEAGLLVAVPKFEELSDPCVMDCRGKILRLISRCCGTRGQPGGYR